MPRDGILHAGLNHTLRCNVNISDLTVPFVTVSIHWLKNEQILKSCSDLSSSNSYHCLLTLTHLRYVSDNGSYSCRADVTPTARYPLLTARSVTSTSLDLRVASKFQHSTLLFFPTTFFPSRFPSPSLVLHILTYTNSFSSCCESQNIKWNYSAVGCSSIQSV